MASEKPKKNPGTPMDDPSLKGFARYFNTATVRGRANIAKAAVAGLCVFYVFKKFCPSTQQVVEQLLKNETKVVSLHGSNAGPQPKKEDEMKSERKESFILILHLSPKPE